MVAVAATNATNIHIEIRMKLLKSTLQSRLKSGSSASLRQEATGNALAVTVQ
jgi:hypothetical protein